jgi:EmrB/QacA subfamily drug resistance transporter
MKYQWVVLTVTTVGVLMAGIDSRIVMIGLPQVASALGADVEQAIWFTQSYVLGTTIALLLIGRISDMVGRVKIYTLGFATFTFGSALTSLSRTPLQFILSRAIQGLGAGMIFTNSLAIVADATPKNQLGFALGVNQTAFRFGAMAGLTFSGLILSFLNWRALFYLNVPIGIFGTIWAHRRLKELAKLDTGAKMDLVGFVTFSISILTFLLALTYQAYGLSEEFTVYSFFIISVIGLIVFIVNERKELHPLLDLRLFRIREFTGGVIAQLLNAVAWGAMLLLVSLYFQLILDLSPLNAGIRILPFDAAFLICGVISGRLSDKYGHLPFTTLGLALMSLSLYALSTLTQATSFLHIIVYLVSLGIGCGAFVSPNVSSIMSSVPAERRGIASGLRATFFNIGFVISLNLAILIMTFTVPFSIATKILSSINRIGISQADKMLFMKGLNNTYLWLAVINSAAIPPSVLRGRGRKANQVKK